MTTATAPTGAVVITREGRERLTQRLRDLDTTVLPQLREQLWTKDRDWNDDMALAAALAERHSIRSALAVSVDAEAVVGALLNMVWAGSGIVGPIVGGSVSGAVGDTAVFLILAAVSVACAGWMWTRRRGTVRIADADAGGR